MIYFRNLDLLRFFAAYMVLLAHAYEFLTGYKADKHPFVDGENDQLGKLAEQTIKNGGYGVDVFFLISGFLITYLLIQEKKKTGTINYPKFFMRRALRIWPVYFSFIGIGYFLVNWLNKEYIPDYLGSFFFYHNFFEIYSYPSWIYPFAHFWSICVEEHFYLFWPVLLWLLPKKIWPYLALTGILISISFRLYINYPDHSSLQTYLNTLSRMDVILIGCLFALYFDKYGFPQRNFLVLNTVLLLVFTSIFSTRSVNEYLGFDGEMSYFLIAFKKLFLAILVGWLMACVVLGRFKDYTNRFIRFLNYLGKISFGIYLASNMVMEVIWNKIMANNGLYSNYLFIILTTLISILLAMIFYHCMEKPVLKLKKRFEIIQTTR